MKNFIFCAVFFFCPFYVYLILYILKNEEHVFYVRLLKLIKPIKIIINQNWTTQFKKRLRQNFPLVFSYYPTKAHDSNFPHDRDFGGAGKMWICPTPTMTREATPNPCVNRVQFKMRIIRSIQQS